MLPKIWVRLAHHLGRGDAQPRQEEGARGKGHGHAVVWGDVVQGFILVGGAIFAVAWLALGTEGGITGFFDIAAADGKFRLFDWSLSYKSATFWVIIIGGMANNLISYASDQPVIQRSLTTRDEGEARRSIMLNGVMSVFVKADDTVLIAIVGLHCEAQRTIVQYLVGLPAAGPE